MLTRRSSAKSTSQEDFKIVNERSPTGQNAAQIPDRQSLTQTPQNQNLTYAKALNLSLDGATASGSPVQVLQRSPPPTNNANLLYKSLVADEDTSNCKLCDKVVTDRCKALTCDRCDAWWHLTCAGLTEYEFNFYDKNPLPPGEIKSKWFCQSCSAVQQSNIEPLDIIAKLVTKVEKQTTEINTVKKCLATVMELLMANKTEDKKVKETVQKVEETVQNSVTEALDNCKEKEEKEKNVIFFNVPQAKEQQGKTEADKKHEDLLTVNSIMEDADKESFKPMMKKENVTRLGNRRPGATHPRPIKVTFDNIEEKWLLLKKAKNLKESLLYKEVRIHHDKTKKELNEDRKLTAECNKLRRETKQDYIIFAQQILLRKDVPAFKEERKKRQEEQRKANEESA